MRRLFTVLALVGLIAGIGYFSISRFHPAQAHAASSTTIISPQWAGYALTGPSPIATLYTSVQGTWVEPHIVCPAIATYNAYSSFWIGTDGNLLNPTPTTSFNPVEQIGSDADCVNGALTLYAWWNAIPNAAQSIPSTRHILPPATYPVRSGDVLTGSVRASNSITATGVTFTLVNATERWTFTTTQPAPFAAYTTAEWVVEDPSALLTDVNALFPLADFGTVPFTNCTANGVAIIAHPNVAEIIMESNGIVKAVPSALDNTGAGFSVTWKHS